MERTNKARPRPDPDDLSRMLGDWYRVNGRPLPWRGEDAADPYRVWLSEIMLQQTTVATVMPYYRSFLGRWPEVAALASAPLDDVLHAWQGLGYYARARNLHACARRVAAGHGGHFPDTEDELLKLPGIGPYAAAAIAAIAFGKAATVVDGNVERVIARLDAIETPLPAAKPEIRARAAALTPAQGAGDHAQAMMDLGATVCTPRNPACGSCPWTGACRARALGIAGDLPKRTPRRQRPRRYGVAFWLERGDGRVLVRRRPDAGLLGGMMEVPTTAWLDTPWDDDAARAAAPAAADWRPLPGVVGHTFTHFHLELRVFIAEGSARGRWQARDALGELALSTLIKKVVRHVERTRSASLCAQDPDGRPARLGL